MLSSRIHWYAAIASLMVFCVGARGQEEALKKRAAVLNFDNPDVGADAPSGLFGADGENVGQGVSAMLVQKLVQGGKYTLIDRSALEELLKEQSEAHSDRVDAYGLATRIGRLLGLDAMIVGAITRYGPENKQGNAGSGGFGVHARKSKAYVEITAEVLNISTGAIMADFKGAGDSSRLGEISTMSTRGHAKTSVQILGNEFVESLLPEATNNAVEQIATQLNGFAEKIPALQISVEGQVAEVAGTALTLNVGKKSGLRIGQQVEILREAPPAPGSNAPPEAPRLLKRIGLATITEMGEEYATATFSEPASAQVGDLIRLAAKVIANSH